MTHVGQKLRFCAACVFRGVAGQLQLFDTLSKLGGLLLDLTTDVPESVIMPEILVPQGQTSVTINVQGGRPGSGSLFLKGYGAGELSVPITVSAK